MYYTPEYKLFLILSKVSHLVLRGLTDLFITSDDLHHHVELSKDDRPRINSVVWDYKHYEWDRKTEKPDRVYFSIGDGERTYHCRILVPADELKNTILGEMQGLGSRSKRNNLIPRRKISKVQVCISSEQENVALELLEKLVIEVNPKMGNETKKSYNQRFDISLYRTGTDPIIDMYWLK